MIYTPMWMNLLIFIYEDISITLLARQMNASYTNVFNIVKDLESKTILTITKNGRDNKIILTPKGRRIVLCLNELNTLMTSEE